MSRCTFWIQVAIVFATPPHSAHSLSLSLCPLAELMQVLFHCNFPRKWIALPFANNPQRQLAKMQLKNFTLSTLCPLGSTVRSSWPSSCLYPYSTLSPSPSRFAWHIESLTAAEPGMTLRLALEAGKHILRFNKMRAKLTICPLLGKLGRGERLRTAWQTAKKLSFSQWREQGKRETARSRRKRQQQLATLVVEQVLPWRVCLRHCSSSPPPLLLLLPLQAKVFVKKKKLGLISKRAAFPASLDEWWIHIAHLSCMRVNK